MLREKESVRTMRVTMIPFSITVLTDAKHSFDTHTECVRYNAFHKQILHVAISIILPDVEKKYWQ